MLWIWLLVRNSQSWSTGPLSRYFTFGCAHCGALIAAVVQYLGYASGSSLIDAQRRAHAVAEGNAYRAVNAAACPSCGRLQPSTLAQYEHAQKRAARKRALRFPVAGAIAAAVLVLVGIAALADLRYSLLLGVVAFSAAVAVGALVAGLMSFTVATPSADPSGVWFSQDPNAGPNAWFAARPGPAPVVDQPSALARTIAFVAMAVTGLSAVIALALWSDTFRKVHVVSAEGARGDLVVRIDGEDVGRVANGDAPRDDAPHRVFEVRTNQVHQLEIADAAGQRASYVLDPAASSHGWVLAPHSAERGLCLTRLTWYYGGKPPSTNDDAVLNTDGDLVVLSRRYDVVLTAPPATIETKQSQETRTTLRALDCDALERESVTPWRNGKNGAWD